MSPYDRTITAALAETTSKFDLAEALALEIPARSPGGSATDPTKIHDCLNEAREAVIAAGGEPKSVRTFAEYRKTALWVMIESWPVNGPTFRWVKDASYTAHREAYDQGMTYGEFAALPSKKARDIRPSKQDNYTPADRLRITRETLSDPTMAREALNDPPTAKSATEALTSTPQATDRTYQAARDAKIKNAQDGTQSQEQPKADAKRDRIIRIEQLAEELIGKLVNVLDADLDPVGQRLAFMDANLDALSDSYRKRLARAAKEVAARASEWEDRMLGISGHTVTAAPTYREEEAEQL